MMMQCASVERQRRNHWNFLISKFETECVFFEDSLITPASWPIKLHNTLVTIFEPNLVDTILKTIQLQQSSITACPEAFNRVQYPIGGQIKKRSFSIHGWLFPITSLLVSIYCTCPAVVILASTGDRNYTVVLSTIRMVFHAT